MTNPSPPSSPFEQVAQAAREFEADLSSRCDGPARDRLRAALKLVEERPEPRDEDLHGASSSGPVADPGARIGQGTEADLWGRLVEIEALLLNDDAGAALKVCQRPLSETQAEPPSGEAPKQQHVGHQPEGEPPVKCGNCGAGIRFEPGQLVGDPQAIEQVRRAVVEQPRGEPLDGAEAHELYSMFLANVDPAAFHPGHPLVTGAEKLAAMLDENHARFSEVLPDQPRGEPSEEVERELRRLARELRGTVSGPHAHFCQALGQRLANLADKLAIDNPSGEGPRCTCERGANLDHWSRCDVHRVERSYTAPLTPSDTEAPNG